MEMICELWNEIDGFYVCYMLYTSTRSTVDNVGELEGRACDAMRPQSEDYLIIILSKQ